MTSAITKEKLNKAVEILIANGIKKTGGGGGRYFPFTGYNDLKISEVEMLEFLIGFDGATEKLEELVREDKYTSLGFAINMLMYWLNKIHAFGFLDSSKVKVLDTVKDMSEIQLKPRHIIFLNILKSLKTDIEKLFVEAYNQTHSHLNPFRVEQVLFYLREFLEYEGIKTEYKDFSEAVPHTFTGDWKPYFCKSNYGYYILDSFGGYGGSLGLYPKNSDGTGIEWSYMSRRKIVSWYGSKSGAEASVMKLRNLNSIAGIEGLDWTIKFANMNDVRDLWPNRQYEQGEYIHINKDVPRGCITKHRKQFKEINHKYKLLRKVVA